MDLKTENEPPKHWSDCSIYADPIALGAKCDCGGYKTEPVNPYQAALYNCGEALV